MRPLDMDQVNGFVNENIVLFHNARLERIKAIKLKEVLRKKNPYLFKAKNIQKASDLIHGILDAFISASEEKMFGDFLEDLAVYICGQVYGGNKSSATGIDLEFRKDSIHFLVSIKSGPNWGNSSQYAALERNFSTAVRILSQSVHTIRSQPILGICYGKTKSINRGLYIKYTGQNFWYFISGNQNLFTDIIEPIGYEAKQHNDAYQIEKSKVYNLFEQKFLNDYCSSGLIDWAAIVEFNSGNLDI